MERLLFHRGRFSIVAGETRLILGNLRSATSPEFLRRRLSRSVRSICSLERRWRSARTHMLCQLYAPWNFFGNVAVVPDDFPGDTRWP